MGVKLWAVILSSGSVSCFVSEVISPLTSGIKSSLFPIEASRASVERLESVGLLLFWSFKDDFLVFAFIVVVVFTSELVKTC